MAIILLCAANLIMSNLTPYTQFQVVLLHTSGRDTTWDRASGLYLWNSAPLLRKATVSLHYEDTAGNFVRHSPLKLQATPRSLATYLSVSKSS